MNGKISLAWKDNQRKDNETVELSAYPSSIKPAEAHANSFHAGFHFGESMKSKGYKSGVHYSHADNPFHPQKEASHHHAWKSGHEAHVMHSGQNKTAG